MSPWKRSLSCVPAPWPLSLQWWYRRPWPGALYSKSNRQTLLFVKHEYCAFGPKCVVMKTSVNPQSAAQVAHGDQRIAADDRGEHHQQPECQRQLHPGGHPRRRPSSS